MFRTNPFQDEGLLRAIEANDPNNIPHVSIRAGDTVAVSYDIGSEDAVAVSYEEFDRFGRALANNTSIKDLYLEVSNPEDNVDLAGWLRFLGLISRNRSIEKIYYYSDHTAERPLRVNSAMDLQQFFERNGALKSAIFWDLEHEEAEEFASALASRETALKSIAIKGKTSIEILRLIFEKKPAAVPKEVFAEPIGNGGADALAQLLELANDVDIRELDLSLSEFGPRDLQRIARALATRDSPLDTFKIPPLSDLFLVDFATAFGENPDLLPNILNLMRNHICSEGPSKTPKSLSFSIFHNNFMEPIEELLRNRVCPMEQITLGRDIPDDFFRCITSVCCNDTSINTTYHSNHTLIKVDCDCPQLKHYLAMNRDPDKEKVARIKVYDTHFARNFQPDFFADMQPSLLSEVLPFVNQAFADHEEFTSEESPNGNETAKQATNNCLSIHFMMLKEHPSLLSNRLVNRY